MKPPTCEALAAFRDELKRWQIWEQDRGLENEMNTTKETTLTLRDADETITITLDADGNLTHTTQSDVTPAYAFVRHVQLLGDALEQLRSVMATEDTGRASALALFHAASYYAEFTRAIVTLEQFEADFSGRAYDLIRGWWEPNLEDFTSTARRYMKGSWIDGYALSVEVTPTDDQLAAMFDRYMAREAV